MAGSLYDAKQSITFIAFNMIISTHYWHK